MLVGLAPSCDMLRRQATVPSIDQLIREHRTAKADPSARNFGLRVLDGMLVPTEWPSPLRQGYPLLVPDLDGYAACVNHGHKWQILRSLDGQQFSVADELERPTRLAVSGDSIAYCCGRRLVWTRVGGCLHTTTLQADALSLHYMGPVLVALLGSTGEVNVSILMVAVDTRTGKLEEFDTRMAFAPGAVTARPPASLSVPGTVGHMAIGLQSGKVAVVTVTSGPTGVQTQMSTPMDCKAPITSLDFDRSDDLATVLYVAAGDRVWQTKLYPQGSSARTKLIYSKDPVRFVVGARGHALILGQTDVLSITVSRPRQKITIGNPMVSSEHQVTAGYCGDSLFVVLQDGSNLKLVFVEYQ